MQGTNTMNFDKLDEWRLWPIHAVSGCTADGKVFTSARIVRPDVTDAVNKKGGTVKVSGARAAAMTALT